MKKLITFLTLLTLFFTTAGAKTFTDVLNRDLIGATGTGYTSWSGLTVTSKAVYAGVSAGGNSSIQLGTEYDSGIYTTGSGGKIKSISVTWNSSTANGIKLVVYGKNTAYTTASQMRNTSKQGDRLGYIYHGDANNGTTTTLTVTTGDYEYICLWCVSGTIYLDDITINWEIPSCSTVAEINALDDNTVFEFTGNLVVSGSGGGDSGKHLYAQDATGGVHLFDNMPDYATEDVIPPGFIAKKITQNGAVELTDLQNMSEATTTGELNAKELTPSQVTQNNPFIYALIKNALIEQPGEFMSINVNGESVSLQQMFPGVEEPTVGKTYNIYGVTNWNNNPRFMPLAYEELYVDPGDGYYLVGNFNMESDGTTWVVKDARYKFTEENGTYTLNTNLPNITYGVFFKVVHVDGNTNTWYGGEAGDYFGITKTVNSNIELKTGDAGKNFKLNIGGPTNFTINPNNNTLSLNVSREALLYYKGDNNSWDLAPMTATDNVWTTSQEITAEGKFSFADEWGDHHGGSNITITSSDYNTEIPVTDNGDFTMENAGEYLLLVNNALSTLTVEASRNITCTAISDVPNSHNEQDGYKAGGEIVAKVDGTTATKALPGETVTLDVSPWSGYTLHNVVLKYSVTVDDEVTVIENELTPVNGVYSFEMPNADVEVTANFYAGGYDITVDSPHGTYNGPYSATVGETVEFNITDIEDGYRIIGVNATFTNNNGGTTSLTIKKNQNNSYSFGMPPFPVHIEVVYKHHSTAAGLWNLVTEASQLVDGNEYIIVYPDYYGDGHMTISTTQNRNNRGATSIAFEDFFSVAGVTNDDTQVFKLEADASSGWYFKADGGYIYAASSNNNWLRTGVQKNDNAKASITFEAGQDGIVYANIVFQGDNTRNDLRYNPNNGSPLFSCYASTSTLPKVSLYTRGEILEPNPPEFWPAPGELMPEDFYAEVWSEYEDRAAIYYLLDPNEPPTNPNTVKTEGARADNGWGWGNIFVPGPGTHTIYAVAEVYGHLSEIASVTYNTYSLGDWKLVTNNRDLFVEQYEYIIVNEDYNKVIGAFDDNNKCFVALPCNENYVTFDPTYETATVNSEDVKIFSLQYEHGSGSWREGYLYDADGYYYHAIGHVSNWDQEPPTPAIVRTQEPQESDDLVWAYNGGHTGYVYLEHDNSNISYNTVDGVFDCHNWNYPLDDHHTRIRLYYRAKPISLANLCQEGSLWQEYTISDELIAVACAEDEWGSVYLWCKDQAESINPTTNPDPKTYEDFMVVHSDFNGPWDQSNWIALRFNNGSDRNEAIDLYGTIKEYVGYKIKPETVKGYYANKYNYVLEMSTSSLETNGSFEYPLNWYCPANFLTDNHNGGATGHTTNTTNKHYFFMNPKIQEVCQITFAVWDGEKFVLPDVASGNSANIYGAFNVYWDFNHMYAEDPQTGNVIYNLYEDLVVGAAYKFKAIVQRPEPIPKKASTSSLREGETGHTPGNYSPDSNYKVYPFDFDPKSPNNIITNINIVGVGNAKVKNVKYVNIAGIVSDTPFQGVNIVVTEYTDGTRTTTKMLKK